MLRLVSFWETVGDLMGGQEVQRCIVREAQRGGLRGVTEVLTRKIGCF